MRQVIRKPQRALYPASVHKHPPPDHLTLLGWTRVLTTGETGRASRRAGGRLRGEQAKMYNTVPTPRTLVPIPASPKPHFPTPGPWFPSQDPPDPTSHPQDPSTISAPSLHLSPPPPAQGAAACCLKPRASYLASPSRTPTPACRAPVTSSGRSIFSGIVFSNLHHPALTFTFKTEVAWRLQSPGPWPCRGAARGSLCSTLGEKGARGWTEASPQRGPGAPGPRLDSRCRGCRSSPPW